MRRDVFSVNELAAGRAGFFIASLASRWITAALWSGAALFGGWGFTATGSAQIVTFDTSGNTAAQSIGATFNATQQASGVNGTPQLTRTTLTASGGAAGSFFSNGGNNTTDALNVISSSYVGFTVAPAAGNVLFATSIGFSSQGDATSPNNYAIAYSTDNFTANTNVTVFTGTTTTASVARSYDITDLITNDTLAVRLYNYGGTSIGGGGSSASGSFQVITPTVAGTTPATGGNIALTGGATTEVRVNANPMTLSGVVSGGFSSIIKTGTGTLTLTGANTLGAANATSIIVNAGTLLGNTPGGSGSFAGAGNVVVNSGGTLGGIGSTGGRVTINNGGTLAPGAIVGNAGTLSVGALTLNDTSNLVFDLGGGGAGDKVSTYNGFTLDGKLTINALSGFGAGQYLLFDANGATVVNNTVDVVSAPAGYSYSIDASTSVVYLNVTAVPEPTTVLGGALMVGALGWSQRRRVRGLVKNLRF